MKATEEVATEAATTGAVATITVVVVVDTEVAEEATRAVEVVVAVVVDAVEDMAAIATTIVVEEVAGEATTTGEVEIREAAGTVARIGCRSSILLTTAAAMADAVGEASVADTVANPPQAPTMGAVVEATASSACKVSRLLPPLLEASRPNRVARFKQCTLEIWVQTWIEIHCLRRSQPSTWMFAK